MKEERRRFNGNSRPERTERAERPEKKDRPMRTAYEVRPEPKEEVEEPLKIDYVAECEKQLSKHLGRGVKIVNGKRKGRFELEFYGQEDLQILLDALMKLQK